MFCTKQTQIESHNSKRSTKTTRKRNTGGDSEEVNEARMPTTRKKNTGGDSAQRKKGRTTMDTEESLQVTVASLKQQMAAFEDKMKEFVEKTTANEDKMKEIVEKTTATEDKMKEFVEKTTEKLQQEICDLRVALASKSSSTFSFPSFKSSGSARKSKGT